MEELSWQKMISRLINELVHDNPEKIFTRQEFLDKYINTLREQYPDSKTPEQTLSRVIQELITKRQLERLTSGTYKVLPKFRINAKYGRNDVKRILGITTVRGTYERGYWEHEGEMFIFANIGIPGGTGHDYDNQWGGDDILRWEGDTISGIKSHRIQMLIDPKVTVHIFTREVHRGPFTYEGLGTAKNIKDTKPVQMEWHFGEVKMTDELSTIDEEFAVKLMGNEGRVKYSLHKRYERDSGFIRQSKQKYILETKGRAPCQVCDISFKEFYPKVGKDYIEAHHKIPLHELNKGRKTKYEDLAFVCANCHRMLHRPQGKKYLSVEQLKRIIA